MAKPIPRNPGEPDLPQWLPRSAFPFLIRFADIGGKRIHYVDEGSGPALLLVSAGQWSFMFRDVIVRLREQFRCLTFDFPGGGLSPDEPGYDPSMPALESPSGEHGHGKRQEMKLEKDSHGSSTTSPPGGLK